MGRRYDYGPTVTVAITARLSGSGCVAPSLETVQDGSYTPLARPIFMYPSSKALGRPEVKAFMPQEALDPVASSPEELTALLRTEVAKYAKVIRLANIRVD